MTSWTADRVTRLKTLWLDGHSAAQVARQLGGVTRNAVIGKVYRLGLSGRCQPSAPKLPAAASPRARRTAVLRRPTPPPLRLVAAAPVVIDAAGEDATPRPPLLELGACSCRYPLGDPKSESFGFCGAARDRGRYCRPHAELVYQPRTGAQMKADRRSLERALRTG